MFNCQRPAFSIAVTIPDPGARVLSWRLRPRRSRVAPPQLLSVVVPLRTTHPETPFRKPGSESPFFFSVPSREPGE